MNWIITYSYNRYRKGGIKIRKSKKEINLKWVKPDTDYILPKSKYELGPEFEETELGYSEGAIRQYRGLKNQHILEYDDHFKGHRDYIDPSEDPLGHLILDAPESLLSVFVGGVMAIIAGFILRRWKEKKVDEKEYSDDEKMKFVFWTIVVIVIVCLTIAGFWLLFKYLRDSERKIVKLH